MKKTVFVLSILFVFLQPVQGQKKDEKFRNIVQISASPVKNQQKTGTCWSFATCSFLESEILRKGKGEYDLAEMFFVRHAYLQKAKKYLWYHGHSNFTQGGQAHDVLNVIREYGMVPELEYPGKMINPSIHDHTKLEQELGRFIAKINNGFNKKKAKEWEEQFNQLLDMYLGKLPQEFGIKGQTYSPQGFTDFLAVDPDDYIEFTSFSHYPYYALVDLEIPDNWSHDKYVNVPIDELMQIIDSSLYRGYTVCWDGDTSEKKFNHRSGTAEADEFIGDYPSARKEAFFNRETTDDHLMHITGISEDENGEKYYRTKNSWGTEKSEYEGYLYMSVPYLKLKTIAILVHRDAVPRSIMDKIGKI
ncbi:MAG: C1 family peptidase [Prolixibacteraceae bacterium]|jgi:bleomycin hydrolase|nr:C1 family peptidase [Prolixibacteraceae bacterium]